MTESASSEIRLLLSELIGEKQDEVVQRRKNADGTTTTYTSRTVKSLLGRVHDLLEKGPGTPTDNGPGKGGKKKPAAPMPVATDAFNLLVTVDAAARHMERDLRSALRRQRTFPDSPRGTFRGGTVAHTCAALAEVANLLEVLERVDSQHPLVIGPPHDPAKPRARKPGQVLAEVRRWHRDATVLVGFRQQWARLRYVVVKDEVTGKSKRQRAGCPYCGTQSLKQRPRDGAVVCCNPSCKTPADSRAEWSIADLERLGFVLASDTTPAPTVDDTRQEIAT